MRSPNPTNYKPKTIPLFWVIVVPFACQVVAGVGLTSWLSFRNGQKAVNNLASQLRTEVSDRIQQHLQTYLQTPHTINQLNINAIKLQEIRLDDKRALERRFALQVQLFTTVSQIYIGLPNGNSVLAGFNSDGQLIAKTIEQAPQRNLYTLTPDGDRIEKFGSDPVYEPRVRPWYIAALTSQKATWSDIYIFTHGEIGITASQPFYDASGNLQGVVAVDLILGQISDFLQTLEISKNGQMFILERSGHVVASSGEMPHAIDPSTNSRRRIKALASTDTLTRNTTNYLVTRFGNLSNINQAQQLDFAINGDLHYVQVLPYTDKYGLDWLVVITVPEADFMAEIHANTRIAIALCLLALVVTNILGFFTSRWIAKPVANLSKAADQLAKLFDSDQSAEGQLGNDNLNINELGVLAESFNLMASNLKKSFVALQAINTELEHRVEDRTLELQQTNAELQAANEELRNQARIDGLTHVANRRRFDEYLQQQWRHYLREQKPLALILCDVDYFKAYNDRYGHLAGDDGLKIIAQAIMRNAKRPDDLVARYGGEEFAVILPNTPAGGAMTVAKAICAHVEQLGIPHAASKINKHVTLSAGVAGFVPAASSSPDDLIAAADQALYMAKAQGRDRCILHNSNDWQLE
jgi:diguanylate cyclase (GGDEF)-like protein